MPTRLVPLTAGQAPSIALGRQILLIGRHVDCDVRLDLLRISRRHCCIVHVGNDLVIRDLGSRNGTRVNGHLIEESLLVPGDEIAIGPVLFRYDVDSPAPSVLPASSKGLKPNPARELDKFPLAIDEDNDLVPLDD